jgi:hypothetical protein
LISHSKGWSFHRFIVFRGGSSLIFPGLAAQLITASTPENDETETTDTFISVINRLFTLVLKRTETLKPLVMGHHLPG